jgi:hypothetical protein
MPGQLDTVEKVSKIAALALAGAWAIWGFVYQDRVLPSRTPTNLTMSTDLAVVGEFGGFKVVKTTIRAKNPGDVRAYIVGSLFNARAYRLNVNKVPAIPQDNLALVKNDIGDFIDLPQWVWRDKGRILNSGRLFPASGAWLDPDEERTADFMTFVPAEYGLLSVRSEVRHSKARNPDLVKVGYNVGPDGFIGFNILVRNKGKEDLYNSDQHKYVLQDANPDRVYSVSYILLSADSGTEGKSGNYPR